jgi:hypothetical protein
MSAHGERDYRPRLTFFDRPAAGYMRALVSFSRPD